MFYLFLMDVLPLCIQLFYSEIESRMFHLDYTTIEKVTRGASNASTIFSISKGNGALLSNVPDCVHISNIL
jgi:hypothetical protein